MKSPIRNSPQLLRLQVNSARMRAEPTLSERALWSALCGGQLGVWFRRQVPVVGKYIADFCAPSRRLIVEVDGPYHAQRAAQDARREAALRKAGWRVLRLPAELVLTELPQAVERVKQALR